MPEILEIAQATPTRILVVDDDDAFRESVCSAIARDAGMVLAAQVNSVAAAREAILHGNFDVALIDLGLPDGNGIDLILQISRTLPEVDIMVVTVFGDEAHVLASIEAGATGYLLKRSLNDTLGATVRELRAGGSPISPVIARQLLHRFKRATPESPQPAAVVDDGGLSEREREVLLFIAKGFTVGEIANMLHLSAHTVATHVKHIYRKLAVHSRTEAVFEAGRMGLL
ncbi:MAG: response regulator transcription factor [Caulobacter sp.]|jgi:DNA-binding NarL/FixJ family response regulator|nr:response regulator transcription factor [Vitreoscilla sp.]